MKVLNRIFVSISTVLVISIVTLSGLGQSLNGKSLAGSLATKRVRYVVTDIGTLPRGSTSFGFDLNNAGWVASSSSFAGGSDQHATLWNNGTMIDLGTLGGANSYAFAVNASGQIIGISDTASRQSHATLWQQ